MSFFLNFDLLLPFIFRIMTFILNPKFKFVSFYSFVLAFKILKNALFKHNNFQILLIIFRTSLTSQVLKLAFYLEKNIALVICGYCMEWTNKSAYYASEIKIKGRKFRLVLIL